MAQLTYRCARLAPYRTVSFRRSSPESSAPLAPTLTVGRMPATSPGMTRETEHG